jgi:hypothetical protein
MSDLSRTGRFAAILATSAVFGGVFVPFVGTGLLVILRGRGQALHDSFGTLLPWVFITTVVPSVLLAVLGGIWLGAVGPRCRNRLYLGFQGAFTGAVLSVPFLALALATDHSATSRVAGFASFAMLVGCVSGLLYAVAFYSLLVGGSRN